MGQIVKRKKKGRPSKADLARRNTTSAALEAAAEERDLRRSLRRRNVRYTFDFDDYIDDEEYDGEEDERRREKKLKLLLKLQCDEVGAESTPSSTRRVGHAPAISASSSDDGDGNKPLKKRRIDGDDEIGADGDEDDDENEVDGDDAQEVRGLKGEPKGADSLPGTPSEPPLGRLPLPDKKTLELILDKLQKKDIYGVYAEPVDPEELPDYHDVIEHPMDFGTVRNKLAGGSYSTLEQFESDVFLICSNAMQYNAPDTIYYKQARSIQELAGKKFLKLRIDIERFEKEVKPEQKIRSNSVAKKQLKKPITRTVQEPVGSDFSSGATLAAAGDIQNASNAAQAGGIERPGSADAHVEGNSSFVDNLDKAEEMLPGKGLLARFSRRSSINDENRRATYNVANQPVIRSDSIFTTFEGESKQLVPVGLQADHSYARSLARFAATLGPVAWKVASQRIEQALPAGFKFGRGWIGEYEPLPTPILMLENCSLKEPAFLTKFERTAGVKKYDRTSRNPAVEKEDTVNRPPSDGRLPSFGPCVTKLGASSPSSVLHPAKEQPVGGITVERKPSFSCSPGNIPSAAVSVNYQKQTSQLRSSVEPMKKVLKQVELNSPPSTNQSTPKFVADRQILNGPELPASRSREMVESSRNLLQSVSVQHLNTSGAVACGLPNGKVVNNGLDDNRMVSGSSDSYHSQVARGATYFPQGQEQVLSDPVQLMRMLAERTQNQQKSSSHSPVCSPRVLPSAPSLKRDDSANAAVAAARAWMSIGAGGLKPVVENTSAHKNQISADSLYNPTRDMQPQVSRFRGEFPVSGMPVQPERSNFPLNAFVPQPIRMGNEPRLQSQPMVFPQLLTTDLSRFQAQSPRRGLNPQTQPRQKQESFPPDLNIGFQSSGSPVRQSSSVMVDSQQPDLALQL